MTGRRDLDQSSQLVQLLDGLVTEEHREGGVVEGVGTFLDERVVVVSLAQIEEPLAVVELVGEELSADGLVDLAQGVFHDSEKVVGRIATKLGRAGMIEAQVIA